MATRLRHSTPVDVDVAPGAAALPLLPQQRRVAGCLVIDRQAVTSILKLSGRRHSAKAKAACANRHITTTYSAAIHDPARVNLPSPVPLPAPKRPYMLFNHYNDHDRPVTPQTRPKKCCEYRLAQMKVSEFPGRESDDIEIRPLREQRQTKPSSWRHTSNDNDAMS